LPIVALPDEPSEQVNIFMLAYRAGARIGAAAPGKWPRQCRRGSPLEGGQPRYRLHPWRRRVLRQLSPRRQPRRAPLGAHDSPNGGAGSDRCDSSCLNRVLPLLAWRVDGRADAHQVR